MKGKIIIEGKSLGENAPNPSISLILGMDEVCRKDKIALIISLAKGLHMDPMDLLAVAVMYAIPDGIKCETTEIMLPESYIEKLREE